MKQLQIALICAPILLGMVACSNASKPDPSRTLHIGNGAEPGTLDPNKMDGIWENRIVMAMFEGLTAYNSAGEIVPGAAESWTTSADGLMWTFTLRRAKWSDGTPVTAQDFVYGLRRSMTAVPRSTVVGNYFMIKNASAISRGTLPAEQLGVSALDSETLEIKLEYAAPYLLNALADALAAPVPKHVVDTWGDDWIKPEHITVNGAYKLVSWKAGDFVHLTKNPNYWAASSVCLNDLYFYPTKDVIAAERAVRSRKLDMNLDFSGSRTEQINQSMPGYSHTTQGQRLTYIAFNSQKAVFKDKRVREALALAIDRDFIALKVLADGSEPAYSFVPPGIKSYKGGTVVYSFKGLPQADRTAKARALLVAAGYGPNKPLVLEYSYRNSGDVPKVAPVLQQNWQSIAPWVKISLQANDTAIHYNNLEQGAFDFGDGSWIAVMGDASEHLSIIKTGHENNYSRFSDPKFDALIEKSMRTSNAPARTQVLLESEAQALREYGITPLYFDSTRQLVNPRVTGYQINSVGVAPFRLMCTKEAQATK